MNPFAQRGFDALRADTPWSRRPRTLIGGLIATLVVFLYVCKLAHDQDESVVWIWMGIRSDGRCGKDFGTEYLQETKCGSSMPCCSTHGWCGITEEYCSPTLGCQSGCWDEDHPREVELRSGSAYPSYPDDWDAYNDTHGEWHDNEDYDDYHGYHDGWDDAEHDGYGHYVDPAGGGAVRPGEAHDYGHRHGRGFGRHYDADDDYSGFAGHDENDDFGEEFHPDEPEDIDDDSERAVEGVDPHAWTADELLYHGPEAPE